MLNGMVVAVPVLSFIAGTAGAAGLMPECPVEQLGDVAQLCGGGGGGGGGGGPTTPPRQCPAAIPAPADAFDCQCKTSGRDPAQRCGTALPQATCFQMIDSAFAIGLLTADGANWLRSNGFCPVHFDAGEGDLIYDFCPMGCFAAETQILTRGGDDGQSRYKPASKITGNDTLMSMTDDASLQRFALAGRPLDRIVHGPEEPALYAFALANGATLRVTQHHPMVLDSGRIVEAEQVAADMVFVGSDGAPVAIRSIARTPAVDDVFNFQTAADTQLGHIIVAEGILVGDLKLQNELAAEASSIAARR